MSIVYQEYAITMITVQYSLKKKKKKPLLEVAVCDWEELSEPTDFSQRLPQYPF